MQKDPIQITSNNSLFEIDCLTGSTIEKKVFTQDTVAFLLFPFGSHLSYAKEKHSKAPRNTLYFLGDNQTVNVRLCNEDECAYILRLNKKFIESFWNYMNMEDEGLESTMAFSFSESHCILSIEEIAILEGEFSALSIENNKKDARIRLKLLVPMLYKLLYFNIKYSSMNTTPDWLENVCRKMKLQENFVEGIPRMVQLSGRTREHLSRAIKKYKSVTLSAYINDLRLSYAADMLIRSDMHIVDLCYESGFSSLDYFGKQFKLKYGMSPSAFRTTMQNKG